MRRFFASTVIFIMFLAISCHTVFAASNTYALDELELQVTVPPGYSVITRDTPASDPIFSDLGTTKSALISLFETNTIYLNAISDIYDEEIVVTMAENSLRNFSLLSDTALNTLTSLLVDQYTEYGIHVSEYDIYQHSQSKFVRLYFTDTANTVHGLQYYTIYDGKAINFTMRSYEGYLSSRQETAIKMMVDSILYDKAPPVMTPGEETDAFIHTDSDSGVTFTVPANWKQEEFTKKREFIDVEFVSTGEDDGIMIFGSTDLWGQMSASDRAGYTRSYMNNSAFTKSDIAAMYNTTADKISTVTYNGVQYFKGETNYAADIYGTDISIAMTQLVYINNGWVYTFQFGGTSNHKLYSDFESLLNSIEYPVASDVAEIRFYNDGSEAIVIIIPLIIVAIIVVALELSRKKSTKTVNQTGYTSIGNAPTPEPSSSAKPTLFCQNCGQALPSDSEFCHMCGTKIDRES